LSSVRRVTLFFLLSANSPSLVFYVFLRPRLCRDISTSAPRAPRGV